MSLLQTPISSGPMGTVGKLRFCDLADEDMIVGLAYHVHIPGVAGRTSGIVSSDIDFPITVPTHATAVCVTIVKRFSKDSWTRHSRCRFTISGRVSNPSSAHLKDEELQTGTPPYGRVIFSLHNGEARDNYEGTLWREWFFIQKWVKDVMDRTNTRWFDNIKPEDESIKFLHLVTWNNHDIDDTHEVKVPGWCFAFPPPENNGYSEKDMLGIFRMAHGLMYDGSLEVTVDYTHGTDKNKIDEVISLGLTLFGLSIFYENDRTARGAAVERISSTARLDGTGDCEDIAKESSLAYGDVVAYKGKNMVMSTLSSRAMQFKFCICLGNVQRGGNRRSEAHAFGMLIPNSVFPYGNGGLSDLARRKTYMCDGVYPCHPTKRKESSGNPGSAYQIAPWKYGYVSSAFVFDVGEVFFRYKGKDTYGVLLDHIFPHVCDNVECVDALGSGASCDERRAAAVSILASNIPRATRTYGYEAQTIVNRFEQVVAETYDRSINFQKTFDSMSIQTRIKFKKLENHSRTPCLKKASYDKLDEQTEQHEEMAFQVNDEGSLEQQTQGNYGSVIEPSPHDEENGAIFGGHTHHRPRSQSAYRAYNPPTPEDFISFAARRVWALLRARGPSPIALHEAAIVMTKKNVYELNESGNVDGVVTRVFLKLASQEREEAARALTENDVWVETRTIVKSLLGDDNGFVYFDDGAQQFRLKQNVDIFENITYHNAYLLMLEEKLHIRTVWQDKTSYATQCRFED